MFKGIFLLKLRRKLGSFFFLIKPVVSVILLITSLILVFKIITPIIAKFRLLPDLFLLAAGGNKKSDLRADQLGNTNLLILGVGGGSHEGSDLTDSIITASLDLKTKNVHLITLPRDTWIEELNGKINYAYHLGETKKKGTGIILAKATVSQILGIPINYGLMIDFHAFEKIVDLIGGVDVLIENTFDDPEYPIEGKENDLCGKDQQELEKVTEQNIAQIFPCRFEIIHFTKGVTHLNGKLALKYVRSRHAQGSEGTDFARSKRQLKLIEAIKTKIVKPEIFLNPVVFFRMLSDFKSDVDTDLTNQQLLLLAKTFSQTNLSSIKSMSLDQGTDEKPGLLINPSVSEYGAWVLIPRSGNWQEIQNQVALFLKH